MYYKLNNLLFDIAELLMLYAAKRIDDNQLYEYINDDVKMFVKLNSCFYDKENKYIQNPCPVGDKTDIFKEVLC